MKNIIYLASLLFFCFVINKNVYSQNPYLHEANSQLRAIFSQIAYPSNDVLFLYDRSAKLSDSTFYNNNSNDTLLSTMWLQLYDEFYYAAHDTLPLTRNETLTDYSDGFSNDTITIGIIDYDWYYCDNNSLETGNYFIFDTVNTILYDKPGRPGWPFGQSNIFAVAPLQISTNFINPTFRIDPMLFFTDSLNLALYNGTTFRLDFGDGTGWHYFDPTVVSHYQAFYDSIGRITIVAELIDSKTRDVIKKSKSTMNVLKSLSSGTADNVFYMPGLQVGVYNACETERERIIIYVEGIDLMDFIPKQSRGIDEIYMDMINNAYLDELRNFNYTFLVVNWKNSRIDMRFNALYLLNLIEHIKNSYYWNDEQIVIIGESMGGVIARYVLTFMETKEYLAGDFSSFFIEGSMPGNAHYIASNPEILTLGHANRVSERVPLMHKTRELITLDSPHQGANIPLSIQWAYKRALGMIFPSFQKYTGAFNIGLEGYAAKQLLIYHLAGKVNPLLPVSQYTAAIEHHSFFNQLRRMGDYPKYAKLMALSSGTLTGKPQLDLSGTPRIPNDDILRFEVSYNAKILKWRLPIFGAELHMRTNPNGTGNVFQTGIGMYSIIIKLKWFGFKITTGYVGLLTDSQDAVNVKAHCVSAGGYLSVPGLQAPNYNNGTAVNSESWGLFGPFGSTVSNMGGCLIKDSTFGFNGVFGAHNVSSTVCTKGFDFGFIPLQSALDYGKGMGLPLGHNILNENINVKLSRTPFDVIMGYPEKFNWSHLHYRDETCYNITKVPAINCGILDQPNVLNKGAAYYDADQLYKCNVKRSILCQEIGDEELYLENWELNRKATFWSEYDLYVNKRNPFYEYPSYFNSPLNHPGIYSKQAPFTITPSGYARFYYNQTTSPTGVGFSYTSPQPVTLWEKKEITMPVCVVDYAIKIAETDDLQDVQEVAFRESSSLQLIPNPASHQVECKFLVGMESTSYILHLLDATGKTIKVFPTNATTLKIDIQGLQKGLYFVVLSTDYEQITERLIIQ